jgi:hypothetical protein
VKFLKIPERMNIGNWRYRLRMVQQAQTAEGLHFFCIIRIAESVYLYNGLKGGQEERVNGWPAMYQHPGIVVFESVPESMVDY